MSKFKIGSTVKIDDMSKVYHGCIGKVVAVVDTNSVSCPVYEVGGINGYAFPIRVSEANLVAVSSSDYLVQAFKTTLNYAYGLTAIRKIEGHDNILVPKIRNVILNDPAVIVIWEDGTKTVVKARGEKFDPEKGLAMAISKKALGNKHSYYGVFLKNIPGLKKKLKKKGAK